MNPLSNNIRKARKKKGVTQVKAANSCGVKRTTYVSHEKGEKKPSIDQVAIYMEYFGIKKEDMWPFVYNENFWSQKP